MTKRILAICVLLVSAVAFPFWLTVLLGIGGVLYFRKFYEIIPIFFVNDVLYGVSESRYFHFAYLMTVFAVLLFVLVERFRSKLFRKNK